MGTGTGIPETHLRKFGIVAWKRNAILLVRHMDADSLRYVGRPGYQPRPAMVGAKTAERSSIGLTTPVAGRTAPGPVAHDLAGLVVHPGFQPSCYRSAHLEKVRDCWAHTMEGLDPSMATTAVDLAAPYSWSPWGRDRQAAAAAQWRWRVDINPQSPRFGCLQMRAAGGDWCYVHGDYELKDVIVLGGETDAGRLAATVDGFGTVTPAVYEQKLETIRLELNELIGAEMVQHRADARFARHPDEPITVVFPDWTHLVLAGAIETGSWYLALDRDGLASKGDQRLDRMRTFPFGTHDAVALDAHPGRIAS